MSKFIRDNQLDEYTGKDTENFVHIIKRKKIKKFKDPEEQKNKIIKRD